MSMNKTKKIRQLLGLIFIFIICLLAPFGVYATTKNKTEVFCPACDMKFTASRVVSTNSFGGQDRDLLARAGGEQPVLIYPITCPDCFYSGYSDDFNQDIKLTEEIKKKIINEKILKPPIEIKPGSSSNEIPAWIRYDLITQTYQVLGKDKEVLAQVFLNASWAVRLEGDFFKCLDKATLKKVGDWVMANRPKEEPKEVKNPAMYEIALGRRFHQRAKTLEGDERMFAALVAIAALRSHGENTLVYQALSTLKTVMPQEQYEEFQQLVSESISRERHFQTKAVALFEEVIQTKKDIERKAILTYLCGELHRRLEHWDKAHRFYQTAAKIKECPSWILEHIKEQEKLLPEK